MIPPIVTAPATAKVKTASTVEDACRAMVSDSPKTSKAMPADGEAGDKLGVAKALYESWGDAFFTC